MYTCPNCKVDCGPGSHGLSAHWAANPQCFIDLFATITITKEPEHTYDAITDLLTKAELMYAKN